MNDDTAAPTGGWQPSLFSAAEPAVDEAFATCARVELGDGCWIDHQPHWLAGAADVMSQLLASCTWRQREVVMYHRLLPEPRLTCWWSASAGGPEPLPVLGSARRALSRRYERTFDSIGLNLYRDGRDSVAWHRDRVRHRCDCVIAIVSVGEPRPLSLRPYGGGPSRSWALGDGDLFVMGGACQQGWEHAVLKSAHVRGPRLSITYRHDTAAIDDTPVSEVER